MYMKRPGLKPRLSDYEVAHIRWLCQNTTMKMAEIGKLYGTTEVTVYRIATHQTRKDIESIRPDLEGMGISADDIKISIQQAKKDLFIAMMDGSIPDNFIEKVADKVFDRVLEKIQQKIPILSEKRAITKHYTIEDIAAIKWLVVNTRYNIKQISLSIGGSRSYVGNIARSNKFTHILPQYNTIAKEALLYLKENFK